MLEVEDKPKKEKPFASYKFGTRFQTLLKNDDEEKLSKYLDISSSSFRQWIGGYTLPTADKLLKLADYFNVTIDYLLGKDDYPTHEATDIYRKIGLSEKAINNLQIIKSNRIGLHYANKPLIEFADKLISHELFVKMIVALYEYAEEANVDLEERMITGSIVYEALLLVSDNDTIDNETHEKLLSIGSYIDRGMGSAIAEKEKSLNEFFKNICKNIADPEKKQERSDTNGKYPRD